MLRGKTLSNLTWGFLWHVSSPLGLFHYTIPAVWMQYSTLPQTTLLAFPLGDVLGAHYNFVYCTCLDQVLSMLSRQYYM